MAGYLVVGRGPCHKSILVGFVFRTVFVFYAVGLLLFVKEKYGRGRNIERMTMKPKDRKIQQLIQAAVLLFLFLLLFGYWGCSASKVTPEVSPSQSSFMSTSGVPFEEFLAGKSFVRFGMCLISGDKAGKKFTARCDLYKDTKSDEMSLLFLLYREEEEKFVPIIARRFVDGVAFEIVWENPQLKSWE